MEKQKLYSMTETGIIKKQSRARIEKKRSLIGLTLIGLKNN